MDRLIYSALSAMRSQAAAQAVSANNLANAAVPGFRRELSSLQARWLDAGDAGGLDGRAQADDVVATAQLEAGPVTVTGNTLDVAIDGPGWIAVQAADGGEAYSRRGDLHVTAAGRLETGEGRAVLGDSGPLVVPPGPAVVAADGSVSVNGVTAGRIKLVDAPPGALAKRGDGLFGGAALDADPAVRVRSGVLEGSNVSAAGSLAELLEQSRGFETSTKAAPLAGGGGPLSLSVTTGSGVYVGSVGRAYDALKASAARNAGSDVARLTTRGDWLGRLQSLIGGSDGQLNTALGGFYDGAEALSADPASTAARTIFLDRADQAASAFRDTAGGVAGLVADLGAATTAATREVNGLTAALAHANDELRRAAGRDTDALLDERDRLLGQLGSYLRIGVTQADDGEVRVRLGDGPNAETLVDGGGAVRIGVRDGANGAELVLDPTHDARAVRLPASGSLAGLIEAAREVTAAAGGLDDLAARFADSVDTVQLAGVDRTGADGAPLFARLTLVPAAGSANAGIATVGVAIADNVVLDPAGYRLTRDTGQWTLTRADGSGAVTGAGPLSLDGATVTPSPGARDGDAWVLATSGGAAGLSLRPVTPAAVAVSARWLGDAAASNAGTGVLGVTVDGAAAGLPVRPAYVVRITGAGAADIVDPADGSVLATATLPGPVAGAGFSLTITGTPQIGDSFRITRAIAGSTDTANLRALIDGRAAAGVEDGLDTAVAGLASRIAETSRLADAATAVAADAASANAAVSGVDLDTEAAELTRLQAAYKANAQVIATARELFDQLLQAGR